MMRKNPILFALCLFAVIQPAMTEELLFRVLEDTPIWNREGFPRTDNNVNRIFPEGSFVSNVSLARLATLNGVERFIHHFTFENTEYSIPANSFAPINTEEMFAETFLTSADPQSEIWANSSFLEVLRDGDRDTLQPYEQGWISTAWWDDSLRWEWAVFDLSLVVTQGTIDIGGLIRDYFWITRIEHMQNGYRVGVTWNREESDNSPLRSKAVRLPAKEEASAFDLYLIMDVFYSADPDGGNKVFSTTFARFDPEMRKQTNEIIQRPHFMDQIPFYPERLTFWPRRADGSTDFPPPEGANLAFPAGDEKRGELAMPIRLRDLQHSFCSYKTNVAWVFGYAKNRTLSPH